MYYLVLGNLQCTVRDMKTESELFSITMIIVLIMNMVYTLQACEKLKVPIHSIFSSAFICVCP